MSAGVNVYTVGTTNSTLMSSELNSLGSTPAVSSSVFNNSQQTIGGVAATANLNGYLRGKLTFKPGSAFASAANSTLNIWFLHSIDGSTYEASGLGTSPRVPDVKMPLNTSSSSDVITMDVRLPAGLFKVMTANAQGSGSTTLPASGNTLTLEPYTAGE